MNLKIFTVHHRVPDTFVASPIFSPFITGLTFGSGHPIFITDEDAMNISDRATYAEMRAHYYVWKNKILELDYVGFHHYRRAFLFDFMMEANATSEVAQMCAVKAKDRTIPPPPVDRATFDRYLEWLQNWKLGNISKFKNWVKHFDIIVPRGQLLPGTIGEQYAQCHSLQDWQDLIQILQDHRRFDKVRHCLDFEISYIIPCNMFLMRASIFQDYMEFWYDVMTVLEGSVEVKRDPYQSRALGFLSERVFTIYLHHLRIERPMLRVAELPYLVYEPGIPPLSSTEAMQSSLAVGLSLLNDMDSDPAIDPNLPGSAVSDGADAGRALEPGTGHGGEVVGALSRLIGVVGNAVAENDARIEILKRETGERFTAIDAEIARLQVDFAARHARLAEFERAMEAQCTIAEEADSALAGSIEALRHAFAASDEGLAALARIQDERQLAGEAAIAGLRAELATRDDRLAALDDAIAEERAANASQLELLRALFQSTAEAITAQLELLRTEVDNATTDLAAIKHAVETWLVPTLARHDAALRRGRWRRALRNLAAQISRRSDHPKLSSTHPAD